MTDKVQAKVTAAMTALICVAHLLGTAYSSGLSEPVVQGDARSYFAYLPSLVLDGDLDLTNQFDVLRPEGGDPRYPFGVGARGYAANVFPIGPALLWLPGYVVGLTLDRAAAVVGIDTGPVGYGRLAGWGAAIAAIIWAGVGFELCRRLAREFFGLRYALATTLAVWLGTPALYYTMVAPLYSHAVALFATALTVWLSWLAFHHPSVWWRWIAAGAAGGLLVAIRLQDAPILLVPLGLLMLTGDDARRRLRSAAALIGGGFIGYLPQAYTWYALHGEIIPSQGLGDPKPLSLSRLAAVLFSTGYEGWLSWTPLALLAVVGLLMVVRGPFPPAERSVALSALVGILALVLIDVIHPYGQGAAFGARRYVSSSVLLVIGIGGIVTWSRRSAQLEKATLALVGTFVAAELWLFTAYELLVLRHGVYGSLMTTWRYAIGLWNG